MSRRPQRVRRRGAGVLLATLVLAACGSREPPPPLLLPPTRVLSTDQQWGVVTFDFLRIRAEPTLSGTVLSYLRRGEVIEVLARGEREEELEGEVAYWYQVTRQGVRGWVFGAYIELAESRDAASVLLDAAPAAAGGD